MSTYSIKDLEQLSGIKAHTLRIWEQRYNLLSPKRTDTNIRYYDDADLKLILNVALLNDNGFKISKIASMEEGEIRTEVMKLTERSLTHDDQIHTLTICMIEMDEERFDKILSSNILKLGFEQTMLNIIYPFMSKIGVLWQTGAINPAQEHFISNLVRQKLIVAIDGQVINGGGKKFLLFLPEGELHEISLLFAAYLIKSMGHKVIYLGQSTPNDDLLSVYKLHRPDYLLTVITTSPSSEYAQDYVDALSERFQEAKILITGYQVIGQDLKLPANVQQLNYIRDIKVMLEELAEVTQEK
ncbi:MAG TPA: helix-turn-helix-type transcriptional regulator [Algoriphagus sp.]|uniref:MerR family transcriptional regulator n=1 Tax=unclassified Algoriphagus TaxID=2641541 RepID=UPI000C68C69C|nr:MULTISPECIES: MerR family transcriptional regulator [unclassified Algoriphagus]MAL12178.1 helix-turn-helix-type transcriptional regulator [Algoriphagus sp.]QYH40430.1 MerR family transcriptional regulator [Algoriphagus sp. NBT04N3]HAS59607.1 helix-turn-helix-type transcriptional regulator [Algoriphagus sp.]HCD89714.1 helix-turn-helix-type transcriptional regulator [Algoriphagus sp.]HCH46142.1 helix-turn-helix-type transcriptional regulator [Algoriphagus sp.]